MDPLQLGHVDLRVMSRPLREGPRVEDICWQVDLSPGIVPNYDLEASVWKQGGRKNPFNSTGNGATPESDYPSPFIR